MTTEDRLKIYFKDYLYGNIKVNTIAKTLDVSVGIINNCFNVLTQELINDYRKGQFNKALEVVDNSYKNSEIKELISVYNLGEFKSNDFTIKDFNNLTEEQKEQYNKTELNY